MLAVQDLEMECVEAALKAGFGKDAMLVKLMRPHAFSDDLLAFPTAAPATTVQGKPRPCAKLMWDSCRCRGSLDLLGFNSHGGAGDDGGCAGDDFGDKFFDLSNGEAFAEQEEEVGKEVTGHEQLPQKQKPKGDAKLPMKKRKKPAASEMAGLAETGQPLRRAEDLSVVAEDVLGKS